MSLPEEMEFECPVCGAKQVTTVWHSINVSMSPELKERFLDGEINQVQCGSCNELIFISMPLLYHDMDKNLWIHIFPDEKYQDMESDRKCGDTGEELDPLARMEVEGNSQAEVLQKTMPRTHQKYIVGYPLAGHLIQCMDDERLNTSFRRNYPKLPDDELYPLMFDYVCEVLYRGHEHLESADHYTDLLPFPLDLKCVCGEDLKQHVQCECGEKADTNKLCDEAVLGYIFKCENCGKEKVGFYCHKCLRFYSWDFRVVNSVLQ